LSDKVDNQYLVQIEEWYFRIVKISLYDRLNEGEILNTISEELEAGDGVGEYED
jgi:hypothetical protein